MQLTKVNLKTLAQNNTVSKRW